MSVGKVGLLRRLEINGPATASELAAGERISPQAVATAVRELEGLGLITRAPQAGDRRRMQIDLTPSGSERLAHERVAGQEWLVRALEVRLSPGERDTLAAAIPLLRRLDEQTDDDTE